MIALFWILGFAALLGLATTVLLWWRRREAPAVVAINPLDGLSFADAMDGEKFARHALDTARAAMGAEGAGLAIRALESTEGGFVVRFDHGAAHLVRDAHGVYRAMTRDAAGRLQTLAKGDRAAAWALGLARTTALATTVSNLISAADASQKLARITGDLDRLFAYREVDQYAELRTAYEVLRELLGQQPPDPARLDDIRHRLRRLRTTLILEAKADLGRLELLYPEREGLFAKPHKKAKDLYTKHLAKGEVGQAEELHKFRSKLLLARECLKFEGIAAGAAGVTGAQEVLVEEARQDLAELLPRFEELEGELGGVPATGGLLGRAFFGG